MLTPCGCKKRGLVNIGLDLDIELAEFKKDGVPFCGQTCMRWYEASRPPPCWCGVDLWYVRKDAIGTTRNGMPLCYQHCKARYEGTR